MLKNLFRSTSEPTEAASVSAQHPSSPLFRYFLLATGSFVVMLLLTTELPVGSRSPETHYQWATMHLLTTPLSLGTMGLHVPSTLNYLVGYLVHAALWAVVVLGVKGLVQVLRQPAREGFAEAIAPQMAAPQAA